MSTALIDWVCFLLICLLVYLICFFSHVVVLFVSGVFVCLYVLVLVCSRFRMAKPQLVTPNGRRKLIGINKPHIYVERASGGNQWHCIYGGAFDYGSSPVKAYQKLMFFKDFGGRL